jgi:O-methyltransferase
VAGAAATGRALPGLRRRIHRVVAELFYHRPVSEPATQLSPLAEIYRRALTYSSMPLLLESIRRSNQGRDEPLAQAAVWSIAPRFMWNTRRVETFSSYNEHLAIAAHIIGVPSHTRGCVVECGCYRGGSTVNLSLAAAMTGRELHVFDSFEGLPTPLAGGAENVVHHERAKNSYERGMYAAPLDEVRENVRRFGDIGVCHFHKGWFDDTLAGFAEPCVAAFCDVDLRASLETCVRAIWPTMVDGGALFVHEARHHEIASLFFDEDWWERNVGDRAPGLIGAGTGLGLDPLIGGWGSQLGYARKAETAAYRSVRG